MFDVTEFIVKNEQPQNLKLENEMNNNLNYTAF